MEGGSQRVNLEGNIDEVEGEEMDREVPELDDENPYQMTAFNLSEERKEGSFDASGMYVPKKFEQIRDAWLMSGDADPNEVWKLREAKEAKERQEKAEREAELALDKLENRHLLQIIVDILHEGEGVFEALRRLRPAPTRRKGTMQRHKRVQQQMEDESHQQEEKARRQTCEKLTEAADNLLAKDVDVYGLSYEDVVSLLEEEKAKREAELAESHLVSTSSVHGGPSTSSAPEEGAPEALWELKWSDEEGAEVHGPFKSSEMKSWADAGYFTGRNAMVRRQVLEDMFGDTEEEPFKPVHLFDFSLYC